MPKIPVTLEVTNQAEVREAWEEIITRKKLARTEALEHGNDAILERAIANIRAPARPDGSTFERWSG